MPATRKIHLSPHRIDSERGPEGGRWEGCFPLHARTLADTALYDATPLSISPTPSMLPLHHAQTVALMQSKALCFNLASLAHINYQQQRRQLQDVTVACKRLALSRHSRAADFPGNPHPMESTFAYYEMHCSANAVLTYIAIPLAIYERSQYTIAFMCIVHAVYMQCLSSVYAVSKQCLSSV